MSKNNNIATDTNTKPVNVTKSKASKTPDVPVMSAAEKLAALMAEIAALQTAVTEEQTAMRLGQETKLNSLPAMFGVPDLASVGHLIRAMVKNGNLSAFGASIVESERKARVVLTDAQWTEVDAVLKADTSPIIAKCRTLANKYNVSFPTIYNRAGEIGLTIKRPAVTA